MIWQERDYQDAINERMENEAREWFKTKKDEINGIINVETVII